MSKDYPETGDIWVDKEDSSNKIHIYEIYQGSFYDGKFRSDKECIMCNAYYQHKKEIKNGNYEFVDEIQKYFNYLGNSDFDICKIFIPKEKQFVKLAKKYNKYCFGAKYFDIDLTASEYVCIWDNGDLTIWKGNACISFEKLDFKKIENIVDCLIKEIGE